jgi:hypothetical protein
MQRRHSRIPCTQTEGAWAQAEVTDQARNSQAELSWALDPATAGTPPKPPGPRSPHGDELFS